jgi:hypothetical protein
VTHDLLQIPTARSWRDIPQPVVPRAMSREGRWRFAMATLRVAGFVGVCAGLAWGVWLVFVSLDENTHTTAPLSVTATPIKAPELRTDGVLDDAWLAEALALPKQASLTDLDLDKLRTRLLADQQVVSATLTRHFPDRLIVQITERAPVARVTTEAGGQRHVFLVARDGVVYDGKDYDAGLLATLPWLDGIELVPQKGGFRPLAGMTAVADLLATARLEAEHLYATWSVVSLAHLDADHQIEVRTKRGPCTIYFSTRDGYFRQLGKLNYIWDQLTRIPEAKATIDLSLGSDVPVMVENTPEGADLGAATAAKTKDSHAARTVSLAANRHPQGRDMVANPLPMNFVRASQPAVSLSIHPQPNKNKREL